jgi:hypothetical protein
MSARVASQALALVAPAETAFTSRWRLSTLERLDPELHARLEEQRGLYDYALIAGSDDEVRVQSEAMVRGWRAACARMEKPLQPDDAYFVGTNLDTFTRVVIGYHKQSMSRVQYIDGAECFFLTPDEVASLFAALKALRSVKEMFPDAELLSVGAPNMKEKAG